MAILGERLEATRLKRQMNSNQLAAKIGASASLITVAESKESHNFKLSAGMEICKQLNASFEYLSGECDVLTPYLKMQHVKEDDFVIVDGHTRMIAAVQLIDGEVRLKRGVPVAGSLSHGPDKDFLNAGMPANYGFEYIDISNDQDLYVLRIDADNSIARIGDGLLISSRGGADVGDDIYYLHNDKWHIGTILSSKGGNLIIESNGARVSHSVFELDRVHKICGTVTSSMFSQR